MKLLTVLAATAVAAAVAAALSIPAGADRTAGDKATTLVSCLRTHGLNPPDNVMELKPWMARQAGTEVGKAALNACGIAGTGMDLAACLRSHGADIPAGVQGLALKTWIGNHSGDAKVMDALKLCGDDPQKAPAKANDCGGAAAAPPSARP